MTISSLYRFVAHAACSYPHLATKGTEVVAMEMQFRKARSSALWHFVSACPDWPKADFIERDATPRVGEICVSCIYLSVPVNPTTGSRRAPKDRKAM
jgi:hypothetical protein